MKTETYSYGTDSPMKLELSPKTAEAYNEAVKKYLNAQRRFLQKVGRTWNPETDPIKLNWTRKQAKAWNEVARVVKVVAEKDGPFHANEIKNDFLVKNVTQSVIAAVVGSPWIYKAVMGGGIHGILRGIR
jgi:hypothetical protein